MNIEKKSVREKIIAATIECIEKEGIHALTNRGIAKEANVNSAAINYYFGSKENLLDLTLASSLDNAFTDPFFEYKEIESYADMREVLREILVEHLQGMVNYPGISKAHLYGPFVSNDYSSNAVHRLNEFMETLFTRIQPFVAVPAEELKLSLLQLYAALFLTGTMPGLFGEFSGINLEDSGQISNYVDHLIERYFPAKE